MFVILSNLRGEQPSPVEQIHMSLVGYGDCFVRKIKDTVLPEPGSLRLAPSKRKMICSLPLSSLCGFSPRSVSLVCGDAPLCSSLYQAAPLGVPARGFTPHSVRLSPKRRAWPGQSSSSSPLPWKTNPASVLREKRLWSDSVGINSSRAAPAIFDMSCTSHKSLVHAGFDHSYCLC